MAGINIGGPFYADSAPGVIYLYPVALWQPRIVLTKAAYSRHNRQAAEQRMQMIQFRPMREDEYPDYLAYFIPDYAREIAANYWLSAEGSLARAKQEIAEDLPDGVNTPGQVLLCLITQRDNTAQHAGYLWYKPNPATRTVFIYDFHILTAWQGRGLGKQALHAFEQAMRRENIEQIRLRVAGDNARARHVYEATGFGVTGINMSKTITD